MSNYYFTYVLKSKKDNKYYTGYTKNIELRFEQHCNGLVKSTKNRDKTLAVTWEKPNENDIENYYIILAINHKI